MKYSLILLFMVNTELNKINKKTGAEPAADRGWRLEEETRFFALRLKRSVPQT
jgi:hypothetical protein